MKHYEFGFFLLLASVVIQLIFIVAKLGRIAEALEKLAAVAK